MQQKSPNHVDCHIGIRLRARRTSLEMSQEKLAESLGLTFQQVQKYEKGTNRISASRLLQIGQILGVDIDYFFDGLSRAQGIESSADAALQKVLASSEGARLLEALAIIDDVHIQRKIADLVELVLALRDIR